MSKRILVIGANGSVGSATARASIARGNQTYAFLRSVNKLSADIAEKSTVIQGDATDAIAVLNAVSKPDGKGPVDAVIVCAPYGDMRGRRSGYVPIAKNAIEAVKTAQKEKGEEIKLWLMAGSAVLEHPLAPGKYLSEHMPGQFYPEYADTIEYLKAHGQDVNWSMNCPALIKQGKPRGPLMESITMLPRYLPPSSITNLLPGGWNLTTNTGYNWVTQTITFQSLGEYMVDHSDADDRLRGKRVGILEKTD